MFVAIDILTHNDGIRHYGFEEQTLGTTRGLLVLVAWALQFLHIAGPHGPTLDPPTIEYLAESFYFSQVEKWTF